VNRAGAGRLDADPRRNSSNREPTVVDEHHAGSDCERCREMDSVERAKAVRHDRSGGARDHAIDADKGHPFENVRDLVRFDVRLRACGAEPACNLRGRDDARDETRALGNGLDERTALRLTHNELHQR